MNDRLGVFGRVCGLAWLMILGCGCGGTEPLEKVKPTPDDSRPNGVGAPCSFGTGYSCVGKSGCTGWQGCGSDNRLGTCVCNPDPVIGSDAGAQDASAVAPDASASHDAGKQDAGKQDAGKQEPPPHEICDNSLDDDGDGDIDCADDDCGARLCAPKAPTGWTGPSVRYVGDDPPDCKGAYPDEVAKGGTIADADDADCSTCSCKAATVACANVLDFVSGAEPACGGVSCSTPISINSCTELSCPYLGASSGFLGSAVPDHFAQCKPSAQKPDVSDADWDERMVACATDEKLRQGGCAEGEVCAPKFDGEICIVKKGDHSCPSGQYSERHVYFTRIDDTRSCTACECDHDCAYKWQIFDPADTTCAGTATQELTAENECVAITPSAGKIPVRPQVSGTGACAASGGEPTGSVSGENPITVCCVD